MRFNEKTDGVNKTVNHEGEEAYKLTPQMELYSTVCTASLQNKFYEDKDKTVERIRELVKKNKPEFVAKLAIYTREQMYLRSVPLLLAVELAKIHKGDNTVSKLVSRIIQRPDEITEILAYYQLANKRTDTKKLGKLSKQIMKGVAYSFNKFDEYQFSKYDRKTQVTLKDALFLTHPKPKNEEQQALFNKIVEGTLEVPYTWEVELTKAGQEDKSKKEIWEQLIDSKK